MKFILNLRVSTNITLIFDTNM